MKLYRGILAVMLFSCLALAGCNEKNGSGTSPTAAASAQTDNSLNNYIAMNNELSGIDGLQARYDSYLALNIPKAKPSQALQYPSASFDYTFSQYAEALKEKRSRPALDNAADELMKRLELVKKDTASYEQYYESAAYKIDGLEKGRAADAQIKKHYVEALQSYASFTKALNVVYKEAKKAELEMLKQSGNNYQYRKASSMYYAEELVSLFGGEDDLSNAAILKAADEIAGQLQTELNALNEEYQKIKEKNPDASADVTLISLNSCLKYYRNFRESKRGSDFRFMVDGYNNAVRSRNR